jgi:hypothetical protein
MSIQLTCPNKACGHVLSVPEKYAGQQGTCPHCGTSVTIPRPAPVPAPGARPAAADPPLELNEPELVPEPELVESNAGSGPMARPVRETRPHARRLGAGPVEASQREGVRSSGFFTRFALAIEILALFVLCLIPQMDWVVVRDPAESLDDVLRPPPRAMPRPDDKSSGSFRARDAEKRHDPEMRRGPNMFDILSIVEGGQPSHLEPGFYHVGTVFLFVSGLVALFNLVALALISSLNQQASDNLVAAGGSAALGWGLTALLWLVAFVWKAFTLADQRPSLALSIYPGVGIAVGLSATVIILGVSSYIILSRGRILGWLAAAGMGVVAGALMLILNVKPWATPGLFE